MRGKFANRKVARVTPAKGYGPRHAYNAQEGSDAVPQAAPSELPTPPQEADTTGGAIIGEIARQVRAGILPPEALDAIRTDPLSMKALAAYGGAALSGIMLAGGEELPGEAGAVPSKVWGSWDPVKPADASGGAIRSDGAGNHYEFMGSHEVNDAGKITRHIMVRPVEAPEGYARGAKGVKIGVKKGFGPVHAENSAEGSTDTVPAMLTPKEAVLNRNAAEIAGRGNIEQLNDEGNQLANQGVDLAAKGDDDVVNPNRDSSWAHEVELSREKAMQEGRDFQFQQALGAGKLPLDFDPGLVPTYYDARGNLRFDPGNETGPATIGAAKGQASVPVPNVLPHAQSGTLRGQQDYLKFMPFTSFRQSDKAVTSEPKVGVEGYEKGASDMKRRRYQAGSADTDPLSMYANKLGANTPAAGGIPQPNPGPGPMPIPYGGYPNATRQAPVPVGTPAAPQRPDGTSSQWPGATAPLGWPGATAPRTPQTPNEIRADYPQLEGLGAPVSFNNWSANAGSPGFVTQPLGPSPQGQLQPNPAPDISSRQPLPPVSGSFFPPPASNQLPVGFKRGSKKVKRYAYGDASVTPIGADDPREHQAWQAIQYMAPQLDLSRLKQAAKDNGVSGSQVGSILSAFQGTGGGANAAYSGVSYGAGSDVSQALGPSMEAAFPAGYQRGISEVGYPPFVAPGARYNADYFGGTWLTPDMDGRGTPAPGALHGGFSSPFARSYWRGTPAVMPMGAPRGMGAALPMMPPRPIPVARPVMPVRPVPPVRLPIPPRGFARGSVEISGGDPPGTIDPNALLPWERWSDVGSYNPNELQLMGSSDFSNWANNALGYLPPSWTPGYGQGPTMIPSSFNQQGYPIGQVAQLAPTSQPDLTSYGTGGLPLKKQS